MKKELETNMCFICYGNHYFINEDDNIENCPECTLLGYIDEQEGIPNETRTEGVYTPNNKVLR